MVRKDLSSLNSDRKAHEMVAQHYRWDFIGLSTDDKPTADNPKVTDGSTFYESDTSKYYIWYDDQWYEKVVEGGGGGLPATWADFKAMTATQLKNIYPEGTEVDIECVIDSLTNWRWKVADYGTCKIENDDTDYPCVTLVGTGLLDAKVFDTREREFASQEDEPVAVAGTYYYGVTTSSGTPSASNTTALNLSAGDTIPYGDYGRIYKSSINTDASEVNKLYLYGYNNYPLSNIRQWLNKTGENWFVPSHVGDSRPSYYSQLGFLSLVPSDFLAIVSATRVDCVLNAYSDNGATVTVFDKFFIPSRYEMQYTTGEIEGERWGGILLPSSRDMSYYTSEMPSDSGGNAWPTRSADPESISNVYRGDNATSTPTSGAHTLQGVCVACRVILAGA